MDEAVIDGVSVTIRVLHPGQGGGMFGPDLEEVASVWGNHGSGPCQGWYDLYDDIYEL
jgi:hypothetical protein